jgi:hypothetical protein
MGIFDFKLLNTLWNSRSTAHSRLATWAGEVHLQQDQLPHFSSGST